MGAREHGRHSVWIAQWWQNGGRRSKVLGRCTEITKAQAETLMMASILSPVNSGNGHQTSLVSRLLVITLKPAQAQADVEHHSEDPQRFLDQKAQTLSRSVVEHLRWHLSGIFKTALSDGVVSFNPADALFMPECKPVGKRRSMNVKEIRLALSVLDLQDRLIFRMAAFLGTPWGDLGSSPGQDWRQLDPVTSKQLPLSADASPRGVRLPIGARHSSLARQRVAPLDAAAPGDGRSRVGNIPGFAADERPLISKLKIDDKVSADQRGPVWASAWKFIRVVISTKCSRPLPNWNPR